MGRLLDLIAHRADHRIQNLCNEAALALIVLEPLARRRFEIVVHAVGQVNTSAVEVEILGVQLVVRLVEDLLHVPLDGDFRPLGVGLEQVLIRCRLLLLALYVHLRKSVADIRDGLPQLLEPWSVIDPHLPTLPVNLKL